MINIIDELSRRWYFKKGRIKKDKNELKIASQTILFHWIQFHDDDINKWYYAFTHILVWLFSFDVFSTELNYQRDRMTYQHHSNREKRLFIKLNQINQGYCWSKTMIKCITTLKVGSFNGLPNGKMEK